MIDIIPFLSRDTIHHRADHSGSLCEPSVCVAETEEHINIRENAALALAYSLKRQRTLLEEWKALEGWTWKVPMPGGRSVMWCSLRSAVWKS